MMCDSVTRKNSALMGVVTGVLVVATSSLALAGPKEEAMAAYDQFFKSFTAANAEEVTSLFAPEVQFYGTSTREVVTSIDPVRNYFVANFGTPPRAAGVDTATQVGTATALALSDNAVLISGLWQVDSVKDGKTTVRGPYRVTVAVSKRGDRWQIVQFHNSPQPAPPK